MKTPTPKQIGSFVKILRRTLGDYLQMIILHGSLAEKEYHTSENRDADLVIVVSDIVLDRAIPLIQEIRFNSNDFRNLNFALNIVGWYQLIQYISHGHPFYISAVLRGKYLHFLAPDIISVQEEGLLEYENFKIQVKNLVNQLDRDRVINYLKELVRNEVEQARGAFREFYGRLINVLWAKAQIKILSSWEKELDADLMQHLADWEWVVSTLAKLGVPEEEVKFLNTVYNSKALISRYAPPELGKDLHLTLEKAEQILG